jgi:hypothetical protein
MAEQYGNKKYWEHLREHIGILGNLMGTNIKKQKMPLWPPQTQKKDPFEPSHWLHEIFISKTTCHLK